MTEPRIFYVYVLFDAAGIPRYIGKGKGNRWSDHGVRPDRNRMKNAFIRKTIAKLGEVPKVKLRQGLTEADAFAMEIAFIAAIGRRDRRAGPLTNMSDGGTGGDFGDLVSKAKRAWTPEQHKKASDDRSTIMKAWWASMPADERLRRSIAGGAQLAKAQSDPLSEDKRAAAIKQGHARRTEDEVSRSQQKRLLSLDRDGLSSSIRTFHASQTLDERRARLGTIEQLRERCRHMHDNDHRTHEERSAQVRLQQSSLSLDAQKRRAARAQSLGCGTRWITDGLHNQRISTEKTVPLGWRYGKVRIASSRIDQ